MCVSASSCGGFPMTLYTTVEATPFSLTIILLGVRLSQHPRRDLTYKLYRPPGGGVGLVVGEVLSADWQSF